MIELVGTFILAVLVALFVQDITSNINRICFWLIRRAAWLAPSKRRARLEEEWIADIQETPSVIIKLSVTLGFFVAACSLQFSKSSLISNWRRPLGQVYGLLSRPLDWLFRDAFADEHAMLIDSSQEIDAAAESIEAKEPAHKVTGEFDLNLLVSVDDLQLSTHAANLLKSDNIIYVGDVVQKTEAEMMSTPNCSRESLYEVKEALAKIGLHLGMEVPNWPPEDIEDLLKEFDQLRSCARTW